MDECLSCVAKDQEIAWLTETIDLLKGELKASEDGSGITNVVEQYEGQIRALRSASHRQETEGEYVAKLEAAVLSAKRSESALSGLVTFCAVHGCAYTGEQFMDLVDAALAARGKGGS